MISKLFSGIVSISIAGSVLFGFILILEKFYSHKYLDYIYKLILILLNYFCIPIIIIVFISLDLQQHVRYQSIDSVDFSYIKFISGFKDLSYMKYGKWIMTMLLVVWLFVFMKLLFSSYRSKISFTKRITRNMTMIENDPLNILLESSKESLKIHKKIELFRCDLLSSPFIMGIFKPKIIIPNEEYSLLEWELLLKHELCHYKNHDLFFRAEVSLIQKIYWFNPIIYYFSNHFYELNELICDQTVVSLCDSNMREQYSKLLVKTASKQIKLPFFIFFSNDYKCIERRILNIMKSKKQSFTMAFAICILGIILETPFVTYAAAKTTMMVQDKLVDLYQEKTSIVLTPDIYTDNGSTATTITRFHIIPRGNTYIDYTLSANEEIRAKQMELNKGSEVTIGVFSSKISDNFIGGIVDSSGNRYYVKSFNGVLGCTFIIDEAGYYEVFFENQNASESITIKGTVTID